MKTKFQMEEQLKRKELEDRIKNIQSSKDDLISENAKMNAKITELQQKMANQALEIEALKRNNDSTRNVKHFYFGFIFKQKYFINIFYLRYVKQLQEKDIELIQISEKSRTDYEIRLKHLQKEIDRNDEYKEKLQDLEIKLKSKQFFFH